MSLVQHPPKAPSRRRGGKGRSPRHLKRRAPLPPGKGKAADEREEGFKLAVGGREEESWYQNYQRPPLRSSQMKEKIQQFSSLEKKDRLMMELKEGLRKTALPKPTMSYTPSAEAVLEPRVWTPQVEVSLSMRWQQ